MKMAYPIEYKRLFFINWVMIYVFQVSLNLTRTYPKQSGRYITGVELLGIHCLSHFLACKIIIHTSTFILLCNFINFILYVYLIVHIVTVFFFACK